MVAKEPEILYGVQFRIEKEALRTRHIQLSALADSLIQVLETLQLLSQEEIRIQQENGRVVIY